MRVAIVLLSLLLCACNGVIPSGDGRYTSNATATSDSDHPMQRAHDQAEAFCKARGKPLVVESTAGSTRPTPAAWSVHFRCGYPPPAHQSVAPTPVPTPAAAPSSVAPVPFPAPAHTIPPSQPSASAPVAAPARFAVVVSFGSLASGIDTAAAASFDRQLKSLETGLGHAIERRVVHWGREGEYDVCIDLADIDVSRRHAFAQQLRDRFRASDRSGVEEDAACRN